MEWQGLVPVSHQQEILNLVPITRRDGRSLTFVQYMDIVRLVFSAGHPTQETALAVIDACLSQITSTECTIPPPLPSPRTASTVEEAAVNRWIAERLPKPDVLLNGQPYAYSTDDADGEIIVMDAELALG